MTTDKTPATLATAKHGGRVQLGDWLPPLPKPKEMGYYVDSTMRTGTMTGYTPEQMRDYARAALSAQPSPGGQGDALLWEVCAQLESLDCGACIGSDAPMEDLHGRIAAHLAARQPVEVSEGGFRAAASRQTASAESNATAEALIAAARQPVGEPDHLRGSTEMIGQPVGQISDAQIDARLNTLYREMVDSGQHNGGMSGVAWDRAVFRMASKQPAQAVDLGQQQDAARYRQLRRKVSIAEGEFHILNLHPTYVAPDAAAELDAVLDSKVDSQAVGK